jgi:hypothetical protein
MLKVLDRMQKFGDQEVNYPALLSVEDDFNKGEVPPNRILYVLTNVGLAL